MNHLRQLLVSCLLVLAFSAHAAAQGSLHITHCLGGCPAGSPAENDTVVREIYALSANHETGLADWVAYKVYRETMGVATQLPRNWRPDPLLHDTLDEQGVLRLEASGYGKGSFAPLPTFAGTIHWRDTTLFSNMAPQKQGLRLGSWLRLEQAERTLATVHGGPLYVIAGPVIARENDSAEAALWGFYKILALADGGTAAFLFHQDLPQHANLCDQLVDVQQIEAVTGLRFFPLLADHERSSMNPGGLAGQLGCQLLSAMN